MDALLNYKLCKICSKLEAETNLIRLQSTADDEDNIELITIAENVFNFFGAEVSEIFVFLQWLRNLFSRLIRWELCQLQFGLPS